MPRRTVLAATLIAMVSAPLSAQYQPLHPPLDCMKRFKLKQYALVAFNYRHGGNRDYSDAFMQTVKAAGFNVLMDQAPALDTAQKHGMHVLVAAIWYDRAKLEALGEKVFTHPACIGFNLWDNASGIPRQTRGCADFLKEKYPDLIAYMAENPDARGQSRTPMPVLSTQNYAFGYNNHGPDNIKRFNYCNALENDRRSANGLNMTFWPIFASLASKTVGDSEIRFQTFAPIAYGAQGAVSFAYSVTRPQWNPDAGPVYKSSGWAGEYVNTVAGKHVIGCRSIGVYHSPGGGDTPRGALTPEKGKIIEAMDPSLLAGVLVVEDGFDNFNAGKGKPAYVMLVDKRTVYYSRPEPEPRSVEITFGSGAEIVEVLHRADSGRHRQIQPGWTVTVDDLKAGDGRLIRINPDGLDGILGPEGEKLYRKIVTSLSHQRNKVRNGSASAEEFQAEYLAATKDIEKLQSLKDAQGTRQAAETLTGLKQAVTTMRKTACAPRTADGKTLFVGTGKIELVTPLKGAAVCYTLDPDDPVEKFRPVIEPLTLDTATTVRALTMIGDTIAAGPITIDLVRVNGAGAGGLKINFQPPDFKTPDGFLPDSGQEYALRNGCAYGWNMDRSSSAATRNGGDDPLKKTLVGFIPGAVWEVALENGTYDVTVCVGDADREIWNASIWAEGVELFRDVRLGRGASHEATKTIEVKDGRLRLTSHPRLLDRRLTRINYVIIKRK